MMHCNWLLASYKSHVELMQSIHKEETMEIDFTDKNSLKSVSVVEVGVDQVGAGGG